MTEVVMKVCVNYTTVHCTMPFKHGAGRAFLPNTPYYLLQSVFNSRTVVLYVAVKRIPVMQMVYKRVCLQ